MTATTTTSRWLRAELRIPVLAAAFVLVNALVYLHLSGGAPVCFDDCIGYIELMGKSPGRGYLAAARAMFRAWFVPVFFSLFGRYTLATATTVAYTQSVILLASWLLFAKAISACFQGWLARTAFVLVALMMYAQQYYVLNRYLLSDSLAMSTALWFLSTVIALPRIAAVIGRWGAVALLVVTALFAAGARDSHMAVVVLGALYLLAVHRAAFRWSQLAAAVLALALVVANELDHSRERLLVASRNLLVGFVLPTPPVRQFFVERGMPAEVVESGKSFVQQPWCAVNVERMHEYRLAVKVDDGYLRKASRTWGLWLATHPGYVLTQSLADARCILGQTAATVTSFSTRTLDTSLTRPGDRIPMIHQGNGRIAPADLVPWEVRLWVTLGAVVVLAASLVRRRREHVVVALFLAVTGLSNAVAAYFAELWQPSEMMRHAFVGSVLFSVAFVVSTLSLAALLAERLGWTGARDAAEAPGRVASPGY